MKLLLANLFVASVIALDLIGFKAIARPADFGLHLTNLESQT